MGAQLMDAIEKLADAIGELAAVVAALCRPEGQRRAAPIIGPTRPCAGSWTR